jgi:hypothetical protein
MFEFISNLVAEIRSTISHWSMMHKINRNQELMHSHLDRARIRMTK